MRFLRVGRPGELSLPQEFHDQPPPYAILSHTWGADDDEVTFEDLEKSLGVNKAGYTKIQFCGNQARKDGLEYVWVDTCCINKRSQAELSEAIASMFDCYRGAAKCYVFLSDVSARKRDNEGAGQIWESAFRNSRWFSRGWTLQELLAPNQVEFYSREGDWLGDKKSLERLIHEITTIPTAALRGAPLSDFIVAERMRWAQGRSTKKQEDEAYCLMGIFGVFMLPIYGEKTNAFVRLKDEIGKAYRSQLDGVGQNSVASTPGSQQKHAADPKPTSTEEITLQDGRRTLLASLTFDQMDARRSTIKAAFSTTCKWLLTHPAYLNWTDPSSLQDHHGFLWVSGKPGAGKSTLMKFAHACADRERLESDIIISFFFNARGDELERSTIGMYRALLFQLLEKATDLQDVLDGPHSPFGYHSQSSAWTIEALRELFFAAIARLGQRRLKCFVDALDECDEEQIREMVTVFERLGKKAEEYEIQLYMCFASRHYPTIDVHYGQRLTLEDEQGHGEDLAKYVQSHLRAGKGRYIEEVKTEIREKANGVFMWAVLVVDILNKEFRQGRIFAVKKRLQEIPAKLGDLFKDVLRRDCANMTDLLLCLQWILFARRPLKRAEFYFAMVAGLDPDPENLTEWNSAYITADDMNRFVLNSSKGLAELTKSKSPTVQFIHESVRDFLVKDNGLGELWPELGNDLYGMSHNQLRRCCQNYLDLDLSGLVLGGRTVQKASSESAKDLRHVLTEKYPFLDYASRHILYHADEAATGIPQDDFLECFHLDTWLSVSNLLERYEIRCHTPNASLLYVLAENNCPRLIRTICRHGLIMGSRGERHDYPLFAALANGHRDAVRALLQQEKTPPLQDITTHLDFGRAFRTPKVNTPLLWALDKGHEATAEILATSRDLDHDSANTLGQSVLSLAAEKGYSRVVDRLLQKGANIEATDQNGMSALLRAVGSGEETIVQQLLDEGANIEATDKYGLTALLWAIKSGKEAAVRLLLDNKADIKAVSHNGESALLWALQTGNEIIVQHLLDEGVNIEATDSDGLTALLWAIKSGKEAAVRLLLDKKADIEAASHNGKSALLWALQTGNEIIVQHLLDEGVNIEATDLDGLTALLWAIKSGKEAAVRLLLDKKADIEAASHNGKSALLWALQTGNEIIVQHLLDEGVNIEATDSDGLTALLWATRMGNKTIVQQLLDNGANIETTDCDNRTPLSYAAEA